MAKGTCPLKSQVLFTPSLKMEVFLDLLPKFVELVQTLLKANGQGYTSLRLDSVHQS